MSGVLNLRCDPIERITDHLLSAIKSRPGVSAVIVRRNGVTVTKPRHKVGAVDAEWVVGYYSAGVLPEHLEDDLIDRMRSWTAPSPIANSRSPSRSC